MEIQSAFNSGVQGFQQAVETANTAASDIVRATESRAVESRTVESAENEFQAQSAEASTNPNGNKSSLNSDTAIAQESIPDLNQSIVQLKVAEYQAKASTEVIKTADENLGTLLDVTA